MSVYATRKTYDRWSLRAYINTLIAKRGYTFVYLTDKTAKLRAIRIGEREFISALVFVYITLFPSRASIK